MCGILLAFTKTGTLDIAALQRALNSINHRGPDSTTFEYDNTGTAKFFLGFTRLAIMDTTHASDQPVQHKEVSVICNGEIYNPEELYGDSIEYTNDCAGLAEVFYGTEFIPEKVTEVFKKIRGVFGLVAINKDTEQIIVAHDPIGVRPIFYAMEHDVLYVSSEGKALTHLLDFSQYGHDTIKYLGPGEWMDEKLTVRKHYSLPKTPNCALTINAAAAHISSLLVRAVQRRIDSNRPRAYLLSGGVDSSAIAAIAARLDRDSGPIHTFSVGFPNSSDLIAAQRVADHIGSEHRTFYITTYDAIDAIPEVIRNNESHDQTTTRASTPMYLLIRHIVNTTPARVVFSGEGADEVFGGYLYFHRAPDDVSAFEESRRLVSELQWYDVLRTDRCCAGNGTEARVPFLDIDLVDFAMRLPWEFRKPREHSLSDGRTVLFEKWLLRKAISLISEDILPEDILWRPKVAFSDGVASSENSWYGAIQRHVRTVFHGSNESSSTLEKRWYKFLFNHNYDNGVIRYKGVEEQWLPRWIDTSGESSAMVFAETIHEGAHE